MDGRGSRDGSPGAAPDLSAGGAGGLDGLAARAEEAFRGVLERVFDDDPDVNRNLEVEATQVVAVDGVPTLVLVTPWTLNGLIFPPDGVGPAELVVAGLARPAFRGDVAPLGVYWSVALVADVSRLASPRQARTLAHSFADPFRDGVRAWLGTRPRP